MKKNHLVRVFSVTLVLGVMLGAFNHCVIEPPKQATKSRSTASANEQDNSNLPNPVQVTPTPNVPTPTVPALSSGQMFFEQTLGPAMQNRCNLCHTGPVNNPPLPGPLSIYDYNQMRVKLLNGSNAVDNEFIRKVQGMISHAGGNQCLSNPSICQNIQDWYAQETGVMPPVNSGIGGMVSLVSSLGKVTGYAGNTASTTETIYVNFYLDGPSGAGILLNNSPIAANEVGFNGGISGNHAFSYYLPVLYRDGTEYLLYAYAVNPTDNSEVLLTGAPYRFTAYVSNILGYNYYTSTVKPLLDNRCSSCHAFSYDQNFSSLLSPSPNNGGSATNNEMINMPAGSNMGRSHPGGNICGSKDNSPCAEIQQWWQNEFN